VLLDDPRDLCQMKNAVSLIKRDAAGHGQYVLNRNAVITTRHQRWNVFCYWIIYIFDFPLFNRDTDQRGQKRLGDGPRYYLIFGLSAQIVRLVAITSPLKTTRALVAVRSRN
jgi:hypothetical protein